MAAAFAFQCDATDTMGGTAFGNNRVVFQNMDQGTAGSGILDFAWNSPRTRFNGWTTQTNTNTTADTDVNFNYAGNTQQLQQDITDWRWTQTTGGSLDLSPIGKLKHALNQIFEKVPTDLIKSDDDKKLVRAKEQSEKMLKDWLSPKEYEALKEKGELELPSQEEDVIFIVKRDPNEMVEVRKKGTYSHKLCLIAEDLDYPVGDQLLSKVALLKTNEKKFKEIAIKH